MPRIKSPALVGFAALLTLAALCPGLVLGSCATKPQEQPPVVQPQPAVEPPVTNPVVKVPENPPPPPAFDPTTVSAEVKTATFIDIRAFIEGLNRIIQRKDYEAWLANLTPDYIAYYSDPAVLAQISEYAVLKRLNIKLQSLRDYFVYVVYPSRQNDRVDDIEFVGESRVKAITVSPKGDRQILYSLEKIADTWKIGIGR